MSKIAVGEKVVIRKDLELGQNVGGVIIIESHLPYLGKAVTVTRTEVLYQDNWFIADADAVMVFSDEMTIREAAVEDLYVYAHKHGGKPMLFERELTEREAHGNDLKLVMKLESDEVAKVIEEMMANIERTLKDLFGE